MTKITNFLGTTMKNAHPARKNDSFLLKKVDFGYSLFK